MTELGWHQTSYAGDIKVIALPAIHHSRRGVFDANTSLWAAFLFEYHGFKVYFGGDSAMGPVFRQTDHKYGPIDLALIEIGAYAPRKLLRSVHASPEEAVEMGKAIKAKSLLGMHWGTIELSQENTFEPAHRFRKAALDAGYQDNTLSCHRSRDRCTQCFETDSQVRGDGHLNARQPIGHRLVDQLQCLD